MNKPYHERPDWILKSIVYFCDNYTIDGEDLGGMKRGAIATYRAGEMRTTGPDVDDRLKWDLTEQGFNFWAYLYYLHTGDDREGNAAQKCKFWTEAEKRKIAKMPEVK